MNNIIQNIFTDHFNSVSASLNLSREMRKAANKIIACRTHKMDVHFEMCPDDHGVYVLYDSCKHRGCPTCMDIENQKWLHTKKRLLLPGPHVHFVFKYPKDIASLWLYNKKEAAECLFTAVKNSFKTLKETDGLMRGIILVFHSNGKGLSYHPHIHCLVSVTGTNDDKTWTDKLIPYSIIENNYRKYLKKSLLQLLNRDDFICPPDMNCRSEIKHLKDRDIGIFQSEVYETGEGVLKYLSKHLKNGVISKKEVLEYNDKEVNIRYGEGKNQQTVRLKIADFIQKYLNHIPPKKFTVIRNLGLYSNATGKKTVEYKRSLGIKIDDSEWEVPKRNCPVCGRQVIPVPEESKKNSCDCYIEIINPEIFFDMETSGSRDLHNCLL